MIESDKSVRFGEEVADKVKENINENVSDAFSLRLMDSILFLV